MTSSRLALILASTCLLFACEGTSTEEESALPGQFEGTVQDCLRQYDLSDEGQELLYGTCITEAAIAEEDISLCHSATGMSADSRFICVARMAQKLVDPQECYSLDEDDQQGCFQAMGKEVSDRCIDAEDHEECMNELARKILSACTSSSLAANARMACLEALAGDILPAEEVDELTEQGWAAQPEDGEPDFDVFIDLYTGALNRAIH